MVAWELQPPGFGYAGRFSTHGAEAGAGDSFLNLDFRDGEEKRKRVSEQQIERICIQYLGSGCQWGGNTRIWKV